MQGDLTQRLVQMLVDCRARTMELISDLDEEQMVGPQLRIVNPPLWEIGHLSWFQERWNLRRITDEEFKPSAVLYNADELYDSMEVAHDARWDLPLPSREETLLYMQQVLDLTLHKLHDEGPTDENAYFARLAAFHEDMHGEAFTYTRQTHGLPAPRISHDPSYRIRVKSSPGPFVGSRKKPEAPHIERRKDQPDSVSPPDEGPFEGDAEVPGGEFMLGAAEDIPFVFDNEKWVHPVEVAPFEIARAPVTNEQFAAFVEDGGYENDAFWSEEGRAWRDETGAEHPVYWTKLDDGWRARHFDETRALDLHSPVIHVNWHEAEAYCRWAGRRLPAEAEWEMAASAEPGGSRKRLYPWGDELPAPGLANLDGRLLGVVGVAAFPEGDSAFGLRQMMGNVWEWCADAFGPYPGFVPDPYKDYSEPWFGDHKVLRGGSWATRSRMLRNTWRNFAMPDRRDLFAGFRTCALERRKI